MNSLVKEAICVMGHTDLARSPVIVTSTYYVIVIKAEENNLETQREAQLLRKDSIYKNSDDCTISTKACLLC